MRKGFFILLLLLSVNVAFGHSLAEAEDSLASLQLQLFEAQTDEIRNQANLRFHGYLAFILKKFGKKAFDYPFSKLKMCVKKAPDNRFRLFNWNVENNDYSQQFYCFVLFPNKSTGVFEVQELKNRTEDISKPENRILHHTHWYGALYYDLLPIRHKGRKYYTLLGWKGHSKVTSRKVIDVLTISDKGIVKTGAPIFKTGQGIKKRFILSYDYDSKVNLIYEKNTKRIVFDHLSAKHTVISGVEDLKVATGDTDAFFFKKGRWVLQSNFEAKNARDDKKWTKPETDPFDQR